MPSTERRKKKTPAKAAPARTAIAVRQDKQEITFGAPIDTDKLHVTVDGSTISYKIKATGETLSKEYPNENGQNHAVRIIYGRISRDPHGPYALACIGKIRASNMKTVSL